MLLVYVVTLFASSSLLFLVQPMVAKMVLPLLGGTPEVWNTCMFFFQGTLLLGYGYVHLSSSILGVRKQAALHLAVLLLPLAILPFSAGGESLPPGTAFPIGWLVWQLACSVGAPFFALSATAPLLQKWYSITGRPGADDPYFLYSASNLGSMLALVSYPVLVEPLCGLRLQAQLWAGGYAALGVLVIASAVLLWRSSGESGPEKDRQLNGSRKTESVARKDRVRVRRTLRWVLLSFIPSSWMLGVTTFLTTDIAPVPLLWVIPLGLYLASFIVVFARRPIIPHRWVARMLPFALLLVAGVLPFQGQWALQFPVHLLALFLACLYFHGELVRTRPATQDLTRFYLWMSFGGLLGGVFNGLLAPRIFPVVLEYAITMVVAFLFIPALRVPGKRPKDRWTDISMMAAVAFLIILLMRVLNPTRTRMLMLGVSTVVPLLLTCYYLNRPRWFALGLAVLFAVDKFELASSEEELFTGRSFFGVHRVIYHERSNYRMLVHGTTVHGSQSLSPERRCEPQAYYHRKGPLGDVFRSFHQSSLGRKPVGVIGLGTGAMFCYSRPGQLFVFYEIDPIVRRLAERGDFFTYLSRCGRGKYEIVLGDGRLSIGRAEDGRFGLILLDAFSSDVIPMHLLTREAVQSYLSKLAEGGMLVFHISNQHVDLQPVLRAVARSLGLAFLSGHDHDLSLDELADGRAACDYVALARKKADLILLEHSPKWSPLPPAPGLNAWSDDYSDIFSVLRWD